MVNNKNKDKINILCNEQNQVSVYYTMLCQNKIYFKWWLLLIKKPTYKYIKFAWITWKKLKIATYKYIFNDLNLNNSFQKSLLLNKNSIIYIIIPDFLFKKAKNIIMLIDTISTFKG